VGSPLPGLLQDPASLAMPAVSVVLCATCVSVSVEEFGEGEEVEEGMPAVSVVLCATCVSVQRGQCQCGGLDSWRHRMLGTIEAVIIVSNLVCGLWGPHGHALVVLTPPPPTHTAMFRATRDGKRARIVARRAASKIGSHIRGYVTRKHLSQGQIDPFFRAVVPLFFYVRPRAMHGRLPSPSPGWWAHWG
jgi:hypothetical protein